MPLVVRIPQHSTVRSQRHELTALMAQKGSLRVRHISVRRVYPGFNAHEAGSDVPSVPFLHSTEADLRLPAHPTAAEAHPARSLCAMFAPATFSVGKQGHQELYPRGTLIQHTVGCPSVPLVRLDSTAFNDQVSASRTHSSHGTEGQSPCAAYTRDSTHTRAVSVCCVGCPVVKFLMSLLCDGTRWRERTLHTETGPDVPQQRLGRSAVGD